MSLKIVPKGTKVPKSKKTASQLRGEAFILLGVDEPAVNAAPKIEHLFKGIGGQVKIFEYLSGSEEPAARTVVELRTRLTGAQAKACPFEAYCVAANISTKKMFGIIAAETADQSQKATVLLSKAKHPDVVAATIKAAMMPYGDKDRKMLHQAEGFVPVPRTSVTHIHGDVDARTQTANVAVLPPVEDTVKRLSDRFGVNMSAPAFAAPKEIIDGDAEEDES